MSLRPDIDNRALFLYANQREQRKLQKKKKQEYVSEEWANIIFIYTSVYEEQYLEYQQIVDYDVLYDKLTA